MSKAILLAGLAYGDEAKGATVDFLCRSLPVDLVVRYNGGSQAAHNVVTANGHHHTFSQFGSGTLVSSHVRTHLSRFMLVDPLCMMNEAEALHNIGARPWRSTTVDPRCVIITPFHKQVNRLREQARGEARHGSCGMGVGVAREWSIFQGENDTLHAGDIANLNLLKYKLEIQEARFEHEFGDFRLAGVSLPSLMSAYTDWLEQADLQASLPSSELAIFEGAQGVLLDETHGIEPYRTWTDCTFKNADTICDEAGIEKRYRLGCVRAYLTRHGAGPLAQEQINLPLEEPHNMANPWQGAFRSAPFDFALINAAIETLGGIDGIALSHLDAFGGHYAGAFGSDVGRLLAPVLLKADGPTAKDRYFCYTTRLAEVLN